MRRHEAARTVLARMAQDLARAERIRDLKADHPELTWRQIAEHVGVAERSTYGWRKTGGMDWENAKKLAELFPEVTAEWIWRGPAPDVNAALNGDTSGIREQLDRIEEKLDRLLGGDDNTKAPPAEPEPKRPKPKIPPRRPGPRRPQRRK